MERTIRRYLKRTLPQSCLEVLEDPRRCSIRWDFKELMTQVLHGITSGLRNLRDLEVRSALSGSKRVPATTVWDLLVQLDPTPLKHALATSVKHAARSHVLDHRELPINLTVVDGKSISVTSYDSNPCAINRSQRGRRKYVTTVMRAFHASSSVKLMMAQAFVPRGTNERGAFGAMLESLVAHYGRTRLVDVLSLDAGITSRKNAAAIASHGLDYIMALKDSRSRKLTRVAHELLARARPVCQEFEQVQGHRVVRRLYRKPLPSDVVEGWDSATEVWREEKIFEGKKDKTENRSFVTSLDPATLSGPQVLKAIRCHWAIENNANWICDTVWNEDDHPWCNKALEVLTLLRLMAYNAVARFRLRQLPRFQMSVHLTWRHLVDIFQALLFPMQNSLATRA